MLTFEGLENNVSSIIDSFDFVRYFLAYEDEAPEEIEMSLPG